MYASVPKSPLLAPSHAVHWAGCLLGTAIIWLFAITAVSEGMTAQLLLDSSMLSLLVMLTGFVIGWQYDFVGGIISLAGITSFYVTYQVQYDVLPWGWLFPLCLAPGALMLLAVLLRKQEMSSRLEFVEVRPNAKLAGRVFAGHVTNFAEDGPLGSPGTIVAAQTPENSAV
jgi:hypothetical protein